MERELLRAYYHICDMSFYKPLVSSSLISYCMSFFTIRQSFYQQRMNNFNRKHIFVVYMYNIFKIYFDPKMVLFPLKSIIKSCIVGKALPFQEFHSRYHTVFFFIFALPDVKPLNIFVSRFQINLARPNSATFC